AERASEAIGSSTVREIVIVGRRGPAQASWTTQELKEMGELAGADVSVDPAELAGAEADDTQTQRNLEVLRGFAAREPSGKPLVIRFLFFRSPVALNGGSKVESIERVRNPLEQQGRQRVADPAEHDIR